MKTSELIAQLVAERDRLGWKDYRVARESGLSTTTVTRVLDEKTGNPSTEILLKIAHGLGKTIRLLPMNSRQKREFEKNREKDLYRH